MSEPADEFDGYEGYSPGPVAAWAPVIQPPIYVMTAGSDAASRVGERAARLARKGVQKAGPGLLTIVAGAVVTAAAFYYVPRLLDGLQSDDVELETEGENEPRR